MLRAASASATAPRACRFARTALPAGRRTGRPAPTQAGAAAGRVPAGQGNHRRELDHLISADRRPGRASGPEHPPTARCRRCSDPAELAARVLQEVGRDRSCRRPSARSTCRAARKWRLACLVSPADSSHRRPELEQLLMGPVPARSSALSTWRTRRWYRKVVCSSSTGTRNRLAVSMLRSSAAASCRLVTAEHPSAVSYSRTEVSSMNWTISGGCRQGLRDEISCDGVTADVSAAWPGGSPVPRRESAAICSAAADPSRR